MNKEPINICMISDDKYAIFTGIALTSLRCNRDQSNIYNIYILSDEISPENKLRLSQVGGVGFNIQIIDVSEYKQYRESLYISTISAKPAALYKFRIPEILCDLKKVLYVDGDVLFLKDLGELYYREIENFYAVVTPENIHIEGQIPFSCKRLEIEHEDYFCSGLMLLNLEQMRKDNISAKLLDYRLNGINFLMDQDAFNVVFQENVLYYEPIVFPPYYDIEDKTTYSKYNLKSKRSIIKHATILHFAAGKKPWKTKQLFATRLYMKYHRLSAFKDIALKPMSYTMQVQFYIYEHLEGTFIHKLSKKIRGKD